MESEVDHKNGLIDLRNPDTGGAIPGFVQFSRANDDDFSDEPWVTDVQDLHCMKCHDSDGAAGTGVPVEGGTALQPFSSNSKDVPDVFSQFDTGHTFFHPVRGAGNNPYCTSTTTNGDFITMESPWNQTPDDHAGGLGNHGMPNNELSCMGCHSAPYNHGGLGGGNGAAPGMIHGGSYTWTESIASGNDADYFVLGGYINGYYDNGTGGVCGGGTCSHANGKTYSRP